MKRQVVRTSSSPTRILESEKLSHSNFKRRSYFCVGHDWFVLKMRLAQCCLPRIVGLTGGLACGKSTVSRIWARAGAVIIDADSEARAVLQRGSLGLWLVTRRFGREIIEDDGSLNRTALARIAFADDASRRALNRRTHPLIITRMLTRLFTAVFIQMRSVVVLDVPLLFETGNLRPFCTSTVVVYCPEETMLQRAIARGMSESDAHNRIRSQIDIERKAELGDQVIDNSGSEEELETKGLSVLNDLKPGPGIFAFRFVVLSVHFSWISMLTKAVLKI